MKNKAEIKRYISLGTYINRQNSTEVTPSKAADTYMIIGKVYLMLYIEINPYTSEEKSKVPLTELIQTLPR